MKPLLVLALLLCGCVTVRASEPVDPFPARGVIVREYASPTAFYARSVVIPSGYETIRLAGVIADPLMSDGTSFGDTEAQTASVLGKIAAALESVGASEADVVAMTVYLAAPQPGGTMDFQGMMRAYDRHYGSPQQPNRPARSTVQLAGLVAPGVLVEIEVTAARKPR
jgi:enamine deaminase RidA (YjgF/YER057c/UK114 family)